MTDVFRNRQILAGPHRIDDETFFWIHNGKKRKAAIAPELSRPRAGSLKILFSEHLVQ